MPLITCIECEKQISDRSENCIGCGAPTSLSMIEAEKTDRGFVSQPTEEFSTGRFSIEPMRPELQEDVDVGEEVKPAQPQIGVKSDAERPEEKQHQEQKMQASNLGERKQEESALQKMKSVDGGVEKKQKQCPACHKIVGGLLPYCIHCQADLQKHPGSRSKKCPECAHENDLISKFCEDCGHELMAAERSESTKGTTSIQSTARNGSKPTGRPVVDDRNNPADLVRTVVRYNFSNFSKFEGRANRREYLIFILVSAVCGSLGAFLDTAFFDEPSFVFTGLFSLPFILPWLAVSTRRCHDIGRR